MGDRLVLGFVGALGYLGTMFCVDSAEVLQMRLVKTEVPHPDRPTPAMLVHAHAQKRGHVKL